jgi:hypothetical protein
MKCNGIEGTGHHSSISLRSIEATPYNHVLINPSSVKPQLGANACMKNTTSGCR